MAIKRSYLYFLLLSIFSWACDPVSDKQTENTEGPKLLLTVKGAEFIYSSKNHPIIGPAFEQLRKKAQSAVSSEIIVPAPKDAGGGYTHEQHKSNYQNALFASSLYLIEGDTICLEYTKKLLEEYAKLYNDLPLHPQKKNQAPGKLFWQILNEEVALVYFIQAYDAIQSELSEQERSVIEQGLFYPLVEFIKDSSSNTFNKIHNHAMWGVAGVGMAGIVLEEPAWLNAALKGSNGLGESGFYALIDKLFSPDGYYSEGPYYQRYAMMPLVLLAQAIQTNYPEQSVFAYKDSVILKTIETTAQMSNCEGYFFPVNDAIKSKSIETPELGYALPLIYAFGGKDPQWVDLIMQNGNISLTDALIGLPAQGEPFRRSSAFYNDGSDGSFGGVGILRSESNCSGITALLKFGTHGMGHGHFDQLGLLVYSHGKEFLSDYGASRYLNIPQKFGGRYLPENNSWANQTIAHNALTIDGKSQHNGDDRKADSNRSYLLYFLDEEEMKAVAAIDSSAYNGVIQQRHIVMLPKKGERQYIIDLIYVNSSIAHDYDLSYYYNGLLINSEPTPALSEKELVPLGLSNGYEHLWNLGSGEPSVRAKHTWLKDDHFITSHTLSNKSFEAQQVLIGANDPNGNLLKNPGFIFSSRDSKEQIWINVFEWHGTYNTVLEKTEGAISQIEEIKFSKEDEQVLLQVQSKGSNELKIVIPIGLNTKELPIISNQKN